MTDEEKNAIKDCDNIFICLDDAMSEESANDYRKSYKILKNLIEKQSKEIEELKEKNKPQPDCVEPIERTEEMVNMRWVIHNYILKSASEQKERKAYIKGTNDAHELCNIKWKYKIKAKIEEFKTVRDTILKDEKELNSPMMTYDLKRNDYCEKMLQSLLRKEFPVTITKEELEKRWKE